MGKLSDALLSWLWSVVQPYNFPRQTYNEIANTLVNHETLKPSTAIYTFENGRQALLLRLEGTIAHGVPLVIWIPQEYGRPGFAPICYVKAPGETAQGPRASVIRPGQHVAMDGRVYHPYLQDWAIEVSPEWPHIVKGSQLTEQQRGSNTTDFLNILQDIFTREQPLLQRPMPLPIRQSIQTIESGSGPSPPPIPTKSGPESMDARSQPVAASLPPPLPIKDGSRTFSNASYSTASTFASRHQHAPPLPPSHDGAFVNQSGKEQNPISTTADRLRPRLSEDTRTYNQPRGNSSVHGAMSGVFAGRDPATPMIPKISASIAPLILNSAPSTAPAGVARYISSSAASAPAQDLLSEPVVVAAESHTIQNEAPPIPPNPERESYLQTLSSTIVAQMEQKVAQSRAAMAPLTAQHQALMETSQRLQSEINQIQILAAALDANEAILHKNMLDCQAVVEASRKQEQPSIDEVLVAPTIAAQQLWNLCADQAAIVEVLYCLQRGVASGRIGSTDFIKTTRSLSRELFLKMALARKVASGLGLNVVKV